MNSRRNFLFSLVATTGIPAALAGRAIAANPPGKLEESDPTASALGFKLDTTKVDSKKYPRHTVEQKCSTCTLYKEQGGNIGPCTAFANKLVPAGGWCLAFAKKP